MLRPYAKSLHKVPLCSTPMWMPGGRWPRAKGATREGREGVCLLTECCPGPDRSESFFHCFLSWPTESEVSAVCRCHILNQIHKISCTQQSCCSELVDWSFMTKFHYPLSACTGQAQKHRTAESALAYVTVGVTDRLFLWPHQPSAGLTWNS